MSLANGSVARAALVAIVVPAPRSAVSVRPGDARQAS
jgi:hypothetical protein